MYTHSMWQYDVNISFRFRSVLRKDLTVLRLFCNNRMSVTSYCHILYMCFEAVPSRLFWFDLVQWCLKKM